MDFIIKITLSVEAYASVGARDAAASHTIQTHIVTKNTYQNLSHSHSSLLLNGIVNSIIKHLGCLLPDRFLLG
jgi:hypothetical protein